MIIADIGINHNGNLSYAIDLIDKCKEIGVDVVKFQKRNPDICVPEDQKHIVKDTIFGKIEYIDYKKKLEFGEHEYDLIDKHCKKIGIDWTASVWDIDSLHFMEKYSVPFIKIPSACISKKELLNETVKLNKKVILSTGMTDTATIDKACIILKDNLIGLLHCVSSYPTPPDEANLKYIKVLESRYRDYTVGYSGHEKGYLQTLIAKGLGAKIIERHITLDNNMKGTDHSSSLDIETFSEMINTLKIVDASLGNGIKTIQPSELPIMRKLIY